METNLKVFTVTGGIDEYRYFRFQIRNILLGKDWGILVLAQDMSKIKRSPLELALYFQKNFSKIILITSWRQIQIPMVALTDNFKMKIALERHHVTKTQQRVSS